MKGSLWTVAVLACALVLAVPLVNAAAQTTGINESVSETATVDYTQNYTLANNDSQSFGELTVDNSSGVRLTNGSEADYLFNRNDGTIDWDMTTKTRPSAKTPPAARSWRLASSSDSCCWWPAWAIWSF